MGFLEDYKRLNLPNNYHQGIGELYEKYHDEFTELRAFINSEDILPYEKEAMCRLVYSRKIYVTGVFVFPPDKIPAELEQFDDEIRQEIEQFRKWKVKIDSLEVRTKDGFIVNDIIVKVHAEDELAQEFFEKHYDNRHEDDRWAFLGKSGDTPRFFTDTDEMIQFVYEYRREFGRKGFLCDLDKRNGIS
jgi:hypothetical protein